MSTVLRFLVSFAFILGTFSVVSAAEAAPAGKSGAEQAQRIKALVQALGSDNYGERANARRDLYRIGRPAIEALEYAAKSDDSEVRSTANDLLISLRGRGFMGINLGEQQVGADDDDTPDSDKPPPRSIVRVLGIANGRANGSKKPFPAEVAGMEMSDTVLEINGRPICGVKDLMREVIYIGPNRVALVLVERNGKKLRLPMMLTHNPFSGDTPPVDLEEEPAPPEKAGEKATIAPSSEAAKVTKDDEKTSAKK